MLLTKEDGDIKEEKAKCRLCSMLPFAPIYNLSIVLTLILKGSYNFTANQQNKK
jgi:hypothetical protein